MASLETVRFLMFATIWSMLNKSHIRSNITPILRNILNTIGIINEINRNSEVLSPSPLT